MQDASGKYKGGVMEIYKLHVKFQMAEYVSYCSPERDFYLYLITECVSASMLAMKLALRVIYSNITFILVQPLPLSLWQTI